MHGRGRNVRGGEKKKRGGGGPGAAECVVTEGVEPTRGSSRPEDLKSTAFDQTRPRYQSCRPRPPLTARPRGGAPKKRGERDAVAGLTKYESIR